MITTAGIALLIRSLWRSWRRGSPPPAPKPARPWKPKTPPPKPVEPLIEPAIVGEVLWKPSPNCSKAKNRKIDLLVLHATEGNFASSIAWLTKGDRPNRTSAHYIISKKGEIVQMVRESRVAWHCVGRWNGRGAINTRSLSFEMENRNDGKDPYTEALLSATLWIVARSARRYGIPPDELAGHFQIDPDRKTDPAAFPWDRFRRSLKVVLAGAEDA